MKNIRLCIALCMMLVSVTLYSQDTYVIRGELPGNSFDGLTATLTEINFLHPKGSKRIDSTTIKNGKFSFQGVSVHQPSLASIFIRSTPRVSTRFILEQGEIEIKFNGPNDRIISGTQLNDEYFIEVTTALMLQQLKNGEITKERIEGLMNGTWTQEKEREYMRSFDIESVKKTVAQEKKFMEKYIDKYPGVASSYISSILDEDLYRQFITRIPEPYSSNIKTFRIEKEKQVAKARKNYKPLPENVPEEVTEGQQFTNFTAKNPEGEDKKLSELLTGNRLTILDFWASWCGPCLKEMPFMRTLAKEFGDKGLCIIGISIDTNEKAWKKAIENNDMPWTHIMSSEAGKLYYVNSIPYTIIIDSNGTIVSRNYRGERLRNRIIELLNE